MKKTVSLLLAAIFLCTLYLNPALAETKNAFKTFNWGDPVDKIISAEGEPWSDNGAQANGEKRTLMYETNAFDLSAVLFYSFIDDRLVDIAYIISEDHDDIIDYAADFFDVQKALTEIYGAPVVDCYEVWDSEAHQKAFASDPVTALSKGYLGFMSVFESPETDVTLSVSVNDNGPSVFISYTPPGSAASAQPTEAPAEPSVPIKKIAFEKGEFPVKIEEPLALSFTVQPEDASLSEIEWSSSDETIATVDQNGVVTPVSIGKAKITASSKNSKVKVTTNVNVYRPILFRDVPWGSKPEEAREIAGLTDNNSSVSKEAFTSIDNFLNLKFIGGNKETCVDIKFFNVRVGSHTAGQIDMLYAYNVEDGIINTQNSQSRLIAGLYRLGFFNSNSEKTEVAKSYIATLTDLYGKPKSSNNGNAQWEDAEKNKLYVKNFAYDELCIFYVSNDATKMLQQVTKAKPAERKTTKPSTNGL